MTRATFISLWAVAGVTALLLRALVSLAPFAVDAILHYELAPPQWALLAGWVAFNAYAEGVVGFHERFAPRVVRRALELGERPTVFRVLLGAPYAIGFFAAPTRTLVTSWSVLGIIVGLVVSVRFLDQPWRGIVDAGVVVGLAIGLASVLYRFVRELRASPEEAQSFPAPRARRAR